LHDCLRGDSPLISSIARHLLKSRGKRIRPAFLFLSSRAADNFTDASVDASLSIELIHTATLLHDDVVDESDLRRGQETVNYKWKNLISVLMGDYIFAKAFRVMVDTGSIELVQAISRATERVSVGELRQIEETENYALSEEEYLEIIADKTASLFSVSCETGPILTRRDVSERERFANFGESIGTAFQIADDLLDFEGDSEVTGKEPGNDILSGKVTLPLIYSLKKVNEASGKEIIDMLRKRKDMESFERVHTFITENGGIDYAYRRASELCEQAIDSIGSIGNSGYASALSDIVRYTVSRAS
ncbi:MAG: polyprenyl synthetase family protein, partial [candidate division Zixibacteria bacterium]|nr:polyprenyl synthetase family protein [candidate division Zixibacteria bacterium]